MKFMLALTFCSKTCIKLMYDSAMKIYPDLCVSQAANKMLMFTNSVSPCSPFFPFHILK